MKFLTNNAELPGFQITPMLDVVFLLLCFFVTTSVYSQWENTLDIQLPTADASVTPNRLPGEIIINVDAAGEIRVNQRLLSLEELTTKCRRLSEAFPGQPVVVRADRGAAWEHVLSVLDACAKGDIWNVSFASQIPGNSVAPADEPPPAAVR